MTFVYCDDRWKASKQNRQPGPGQYTINSNFNNEKDICFQQRPFTSMKKKNNQSNVLRDEQNAIQFKQWLTQGIFFRDTEIKGGQQKSQKLKKGRLHNSVNCLSKKNQEQIQNHNQPHYDLRINNCKKKKNQWGNTKILESLNQHKQNEAKPQIIKKSVKAHYLLKSNVQAYKARQKLQNGLKQLQTLFQGTRKKSENKCSLKYINREISAKHRTRQFNSHNYTKVTGVSQTVATFEQNLELYPSNVYRSSQKYEKFYYTPTEGVSLQQSMVKDDSLPTGCSENVLQESAEYIEDATPGPGSYNYSSSAIKVKKQGKIQKFGVTMERFKLERKLIEPQSSINPAYPQFKVFSNANQQIIGFGKSKNFQKQKRNLHNGVFYQDRNNIENKMKKLHEKEENEKVGFGTCKQRFSYEKPAKIQLLQSQSEDNDSEMDQFESDKVKIPTNIFKSKVKREFPLNNITENVDFAGQNLNCLATKLKKDKQFYSDYDMRPASFLFKQQRFKYPHSPQKEEIKQELKIQKLKQLKQRKAQAKQKTQKGYTFSKQEIRKSQSKQRQQSASPKKHSYVPKCKKSPRKEIC